VVENDPGRAPSRLILALLALLLVAFAVAAGGCGGDDAADAGETTAEGDGTPTSGGILRFARNFETQSLDPMGPAENGSIFVRVQIFNTLVEADPDTLPDVGPGLAESWEQSDDGLRWTFTLRDAMFSNGDPVTAEDVKFSLDRFIDPTINVNIPTLAYGIEDIEIVDDKTVAVNLKHPVGALLENLSVFPASIVSKKLVEAEGIAERPCTIDIRSASILGKTLHKCQHLSRCRGPLSCGARGCGGRGVGWVNARG
jgi:ABC-type transport system substrate-binding protein